MDDSQLKLSLFQAIKTMADSIGFKDTMVAYQIENHHSVSQIARTTAQLMNLKPEEINGLRVGATLLDFGIVNIPNEILNKPDKLSEQEYNIIKQHPVHGYQLLKMIDFPWPVARMVLQHHERVDGSGYPAGLKQGDIIMAARIIAVADVVHSITSDRPWRSALSIDTALDEITKNRGIQFDPEVVDACVELFTNQRQRLTPQFYGREL